MRPYHAPLCYPMGGHSAIAANVIYFQLGYEIASPEPATASLLALAGARP